MLGVLKVGGSGLRDDTSYAATAGFLRDRLAERPEGRLVVIVSAQHGATDELLAEAQAIATEPDHHALDLLWSTGELRSVARLALHLQGIGVRAIPFNVHQTGLCACPEPSRGADRATRTTVRPLRLLAALAASRIVIVPGFLGVSAGGTITSLGRGGSDLTAVLLATAVRAEACELIKDVGYFTADPHPRTPGATISRSRGARMADAGRDLVSGRRWRCRQAGLQLVIRAWTLRPCYSMHVYPQEQQYGFATNVSRRPAVGPETGSLIARSSDVHEQDERVNRGFDYSRTNNLTREARSRARRRLEGEATAPRSVGSRRGNAVLQAYQACEIVFPRRLRTADPEQGVPAARLRINQIDLGRPGASNAHAENEAGVDQSPTICPRTTRGHRDGDARRRRCSSSTTRSPAALPARSASARTCRPQRHQIPAGTRRDPGAVLAKKRRCSAGEVPVTRPAPSLAVRLWPTLRTEAPELRCSVTPTTPAMPRAQRTSPSSRCISRPRVASGHSRKRQDDGFGGMVSFELNGTVEKSSRSCRRGGSSLGESLGGVKALVPSARTHASIPPKAAKLGLSDTLSRLSTGCENHAIRRRSSKGSRQRRARAVRGASQRGLVKQKNCVRFSAPRASSDNLVALLADHPWFWSPGWRRERSAGQRYGDLAWRLPSPARRDGGAAVSSSTSPRRRRRSLLGARLVGRGRGGAVFAASGRHVISNAAIRMDPLVRSIPEAGT